MIAIAKRTENGTLPLTLHGLDTASCLEALLEQPVYAARVSAALGAPLDPVTRERLLLLAFLHDLGKAAAPYQARIRAGQIPEGHISEVLSLIRTRPQLAKRVHLDRFERWVGDLEPVIATLLAHHGRPTTEDFVRPDAWDPTPSYDPAAELARIGEAARGLYPAAFGPEPVLRFPPALQHLFAGLLTLSDHVGSQEGRFPMGRTRLSRDAALFRARVAMEGIGLNGEMLRDRLTDISDPLLIGKPRLAPADQLIRDLPAKTRRMLLEGGDEAARLDQAFLRFRTLFEAGNVDALFFATRSRASALRLHPHLNAMSMSLFRMEALLAIPGRIAVGDANAAPLPRFEVRWDDKPTAALAESRWAAEADRRFLAAPVAIGPLDQALLSGVGARWAHLRGAGLARALLVVDEVDALDPFQEELLTGLLADHDAVGGSALLMSPTPLPAARRGRLLGSGIGDRGVEAPYPAVSWVEAGRMRHLRLAPDRPAARVLIRATPLLTRPDLIARVALGAAGGGAKVLVIRNTVTAASELYRSVLDRDPAAPLLTLNGVPTLHHARFALEDRARLDVALSSALGPDAPAGGRIVIGTQTLERASGIQADLLITDLCPVDALLRRLRPLLGAERAPEHDLRCIVLVPNELTPDRPQPRYGMGPSGRGRSAEVYPDLVALQATRQLLRNRPVLDLPGSARALIAEGLDLESMTALAEALGPGWHDHRLRVQDQDGILRRRARALRLDRSRPILLDDGVFPPETLPTRAGRGQTELVLPRPVIGPFGGSVQRFLIPDHLLNGHDPDLAIRVLVNEGLMVRIAGVDQVYGEAGLLPLRLKREPV